MFCPAGFDQWLTTIMQHLSHWSKPQATVLALWSFGMVLARSCALTAGSPLLAQGRQRNEQTVRQQLREWYYDPARKRGTKRHALHVEACFAPLLTGGVGWWQGTPLALAMDATPLGQRFVVLAISVAYRGGALPVAWGILPAGTQRAWRREWLRLFRRLHRALPRHGTVIGLADRGLYAPWLFRRIPRVGWHPFVRINTGGSFRPAEATCWRPFLSLVPHVGTRWRGTGIACTRHQGPCTLLARWEDGDQDPWLLLTDLAPEASDAGWYGRRAWSAQGCKITKRAGWQWHRTRMEAPNRAARLWLAVAVAPLWGLRVGEEADATIPGSTLLAVTGRCAERPRTRRATRLRLGRGFRQGWGTLWVALLRQDSLPQGPFVPEPWPIVPVLEEILGPDEDVLMAACEARVGRHRNGNIYLSNTYKKPPP